MVAIQFLPPRARWSCLLLTGVCSSVLVAGCAETPTAGNSTISSGQSSCSELLAEARAFVSRGQTGDGRLDLTLDKLGTGCDREYSRFVGEVSGQDQDAPQPGPDSDRAAGGISWDEAGEYVGSTKYVCGPFVNDGSSADDVFLNLGRGYPDPERFTIVIWDIGGVESINQGTKVCAEGPISRYRGVTQMQLRSLASIRISY